MLRSRWIRGAVGVALLVAPLFLFGDRALAIQDEENRVLFGPLTVGFGQSVRLNAYGIGNPDETPWLFLVRVFNRRGELAQELKAQAAPGSVATFDINPGNPGLFPTETIFPADRLGRRTLRAEIVGFNPQPDPPGRYAATLEVYSQLTGHTSLLIGNPDTLPPVPGIVVP